MLLQIKNLYKKFSRYSPGELFSKFSRVFFTFTGFIIAPLSYLIKKDPSLIIFIPRASEGFEGNLKYFYLYLSDKKKSEVKTYYVANDKQLYNELLAADLPALQHPSFKSIITFLRASVVLVDGGVWHKKWKTALTIKAKKIQLWHGNGIKKVGNYNKGSQKNSGNIFRILANWMEFAFPVYDTFIYTSELQLKSRPGIYEYKEAFINGQPKNDILFGAQYRGFDIGCDKAVLDKIIEAKKNKRHIVMYAPTWRNEKFKPVTSAIDFDELDKFAKANKITFIIKLHPKDPVDIQEKPNILIYDKKLDAYPVFHYTDCMITDYSSIFMDYLLADRPVVFFPYDMDSYLKKRGTVYDYNEVSPGPKAFNQKELQATIKSLLIDKKDSWSDARREIASRFNDYIDGNSSERLFEYIFKKK